MGDVFKSINKITRSEEQTKAYHEPKCNAISQVSTQRNHEVSYGKYNTPKTPHKSYNSSHLRNPCNNKQCNKNQGKPQYNCACSKLKCYYCEGEHIIKECEKFKQDKAKYKLKTANITQKYKEKILQKAKKENMWVRVGMTEKVFAKHHNR